MISISFVIKWRWVLEPFSRYRCWTSWSYYEHRYMRRNRDWTKTREIGSFRLRHFNDVIDGYQRSAELYRDGERNSACSNISTLRRREQLYVYGKRENRSRALQENYRFCNTGKQRWIIRRLLSRIIDCHQEMHALNHKFQVYCRCFDRRRKCNFTIAECPPFHVFGQGFQLQSDWRSMSHW